MASTTADRLTNGLVEPAVAGERTHFGQGPAPLRVRIERGFRDMAELRDQWDQTVAELGGSIYMSYDWARTWWEFYGANRDLRLFLFSANGKFVGVVPIYIDRIGWGPFRFGLGRLVGASIPPKAFNPPVHPDWAGLIFEAIRKQLFEEDQCDLISIGPVCESCAFWGGVASVIGQGDTSRQRVGVHTVFRLPSTMEQFFDGMDKDERKKRKYEMRLLGKEAGITRDVVVSPERLEGEFESFATLHACQWSGKGKLGHFGSWPRGKEYNLALVKSLAKLGRVRFVRLLAGQEVISNQFAFVFGDKWFWELPARVMDRKWNRFSLGTTGFFGLVEEAIREGKTLIEGGIAHYDYKQKLGGTEYGLEVLRVVANRAGSRFRYRAYGWLRSFLRLAYYKVWYARLSPRLPEAFRKPIWSFWLRLDF